MLPASMVLHERNSNVKEKVNTVLVHVSIKGYTHWGIGDSD